VVQDVRAQAGRRRPLPGVRREGQGVRPRIVGVARLHHPWGGQPFVVVPALGPGYARRTQNVDPFPAYQHDGEDVAREAARAARAFPLPVPVQIASIAWDTPDRTNGHCSIENDYRGEKPYPWGASIVLWGKRIPPHPAMTRYLVAHEYGHAVAQHVARAGGAGDDTKRFYAAYARLRGRRGPAHGIGGTWHRATAEIFANDFRILVVGTETEFWPHRGFARPERVAAVRDFWKEHAP